MGFSGADIESDSREYAVNDAGAPRRTEFRGRHLGVGPCEIDEMVRAVGCSSLDELIERVVPANIRAHSPLTLRNYHGGMDEAAGLARLQEIASQNIVARSFLGLGYFDTETPAVIQRNILENPGWYTQYTPYQPEISQGRLEALLNFQTMVTELTGLAISNASLLDEGTAAAEAMTLSRSAHERGGAAMATKFFVSHRCFPQTIAVVRTRAEALGVTLVVGDPQSVDLGEGFFGALIQYPDVEGEVCDYRDFISRAHSHGVLVTMATDLLALCLLTPPGELGADIAVGSAQRFGVPMGFGGPHAAFFATRDEFKRQLPGRLVGVSVDARGRRALRLALQTREQHIRREKATSNICTAQVLLAIMASMYAVYHGPAGLRRVAQRVREFACSLAVRLAGAGEKVVHEAFFDTVLVDVGEKRASILIERARAEGLLLRPEGQGRIAISLDECVREGEIDRLITLFAENCSNEARAGEREYEFVLPAELTRRSEYLTHPVFSSYRSETEMLRYIRRLEARDLSLATAMIPLGSCTMKLNATVEMMPVTWSQFGRLHPFAPRETVRGYEILFRELEEALADITGFDAVSLQPNAGSQGEYAGLLAIRAYHRAQGEGARTVCLIPRSAHGTNPASAILAGMRVVVVECDGDGNVDLDDLRAKADEHRADLAALMVTYPSTHGVFEEKIREICEIVHAHGGQVYMDGANLNALVGLAKPAEFGADVCHINLHKTFCIPHGGGGPGMGPIGVRAHLAPFLPGHPFVDLGHKGGSGPVSSAPWGSASILPISWMYIALMGAQGLTDASALAILNANYIAVRLKDHYPVLYRGANGYVAHECILDLRGLKKRAGVEVDDVAKRLMDYGFHAPTVSWPVAGTMMVEPTESESRAELDRFCDAMIAIAGEAAAVERGDADLKDNLLKNAPHTAQDVVSAEWEHSYSREEAAFPTPFTREHKFWPAVGRVDSSYGDRNLFCTCGPVES